MIKRLVVGVVLAAGLTFGQTTGCSPIQRLFGGCPQTVFVPAPVLDSTFEPKFEAVVFHETTYRKDIALNDTYYATAESAQVIANKFGATRVASVLDPVTMDGYNTFTSGPDKGKPAFQRFVVFPVGALIKDSGGNVIGQVQVTFQVNAGVLADFYRRNPERTFPSTTYVYGFPPQVYRKLSIAEQFVWSLLKDLANQATADANNGHAPEVTPLTAPSQSGKTTL